MEQLDLNYILERKTEEISLIDTLKNFELNKNCSSTKRGIYVYGSPGSGKTFFVKNILKQLNYDIVTYDAGDIRNKNIIDNITKQNMSDTNIISLFKKDKKKIAIIMDEIDGMNGGDKGGINSLIKLIRPKKTKKQKKEDFSMVPIICISNYHVDKKITEMMKACVKIEIKSPTIKQIEKICNLIIKPLDDTLLKNIIKYIQGDLRKLDQIYELYSNHESILKNKLITNIFQTKTFNEDTKQITKKLLNKQHSINEHLLLMNETDRTSVGLLFHENIIDVIDLYEDKSKINIYFKILNNICFSDYLDRITFQKQIWSFNEMSSLIKTFYNHKILHDNLKNIKYNKQTRFTKVLTKYSTEYNNLTFLQNFCQQLNMDKKDLISYFCYLKKNLSIEEIYQKFDNDNYVVSKLDINRIYRFIEYINGDDILESSDLNEDSEVF
jgi:Cdc6-like AAA superfamily ATPase